MDYAPSLREKKERLKAIREQLNSTPMRHKRFSHAILLAELRWESQEIKDMEGEVRVLSAGNYHQHLRGMMTRLQLLWLILFVVVNCLLCLVHAQLFQSPWPHAVWLSIGLQLIALLFFPYTPVFFNKPK